MKRTVALSLGFALAAASGCTNDNTEDPTSIGPRTRTSAALTQFDSCGELSQRLRANLQQEMQVHLLQQLEQNDYWGFPVSEDASAESAAGADGGGRQEGVDFSGTNNQEEGVDESDFVKTDGYHVYLLNGNRLEIFGTPEFGELVPESTTQIEGHPSQMLMGSDRIAVFSYISPWNIPEDHPLLDYIGGETNGYWYGGTNLTKVTVLDVADRTAPSLIRELYLDGWLNTGRRIDSSVRMVTYGHRDLPGLIYYPEYPDNYWQIEDEDQRRAVLEQLVYAAIESNDATIAAAPFNDLIPMLLERRPDGSFLEHSFDAENCQNFSIADDGASRGFTSILSFDLVDVESRFESDHIVTNYSQVYASKDVLLIAEPAQDWWWFWGNDDFDEATNIHRFTLTDGGVTTYSGSGRVPGTILDQFSLSEHEGNIRVASTVGRWNRWWLPADEETPPLNHVFVLGGANELQIIGASEGVAEGERIWSSRFVGDKGYLVTFRNMDPLFTFDLSDPTDPKVIGELKIDGVSTYIHPLPGENHLLTVGIAGDENGLFWGKTAVSLFDVSDFATPLRDDELVLVAEEGDGWSYAYSEAQYEHKAFQYWAPREMLAIPLSTYRSWNTGTEYGYEYSSRLELLNVDEETGTLNVYGAVDHSDFYNSAQDHYWSSRNIRRSIFMGDFIYAISDRGVTAHNLDTLQLSASEELEGSANQPYWRW